MDCPRCKGLMIQEMFENLWGDTGALSFQGWRCLSCGEIMDSVIAANRAFPPASSFGRARIKRSVQLG